MKPSFWSDSKLAEVSEATRLFYIGLWMLADDAGWLRWDVSETAHELYGYETRKRRERRASEMFAELVSLGRVVVHDCGHAEVPTLPEHQRLAGQTKQVRTVLNDHLRSCVSAPKDPPPSPPDDPRDSPHIPGTVRNGMGTDVERERELERSGTVRNGTGAGSGETTDAEKALLRAGLKPELIGRPS